MEKEGNEYKVDDSSNIVLEFLAWAIIEEEEIKGTQIDKE
jgi:hypothetical protein